MKKKLSDIEKKEYEYLIKVLASAVNNTDVPLPYENINWNHLIYYARVCGVNALFANTVLKLPQEYLPEEEICGKLKRIKNVELFLDSVLNSEIENILKAFDKYKIKNLPLKGYFMKREYPRSDFRSISDFDILFDKKQIDVVKKVFDEIGYDFLHNDDNQYHFQKKPYVYIEMHSTLVHEHEHYYPYLSEQLDHSSKREKYEFSYEMSIEDYYIYMLVHNSNHFRMGGMGIRMTLDTYLFYKNHRDEFDYDYLSSRLKLFKLEQFDVRVREIAFNWFSGVTPKMTFDDLEIYILLGATLGRVSTGVMVGSYKSINDSKNSSKRKSKFSYLVSSIFPKKSLMAIEHPYLNRFPFLLPVSWFSMWFRRLFIKKNVHIKQGIKNRLSYTDEDVKYFKRVLNEVGFKDLD